MTDKLGQPLTTPFTILVDGREKAPYRFTGLCADAAQLYRPLIVPTERAYLATGDYTIRGMEQIVTVERKSLADLYATLGQDRERFEAEHQRMADTIMAAVVVIEAGWWEVLAWPPAHSRLHPKIVFRTSISWFLKYGIPWIMAENRRLAEIFTFRFLEKAYKQYGHLITENATTDDHGTEIAAKEETKATTA